MAKKTAKRKTATRKTSKAKTAKRKSAKKGTAKRSSQKRDMLKRGRKNVAMAKRRNDGTFKEIDGVSKSLSADSRKKAKTKTKKGYGDQGDR